MKSEPSGFIICGTDTDVGKTIVSAWLVQGLNAIYWKPIQSGLTNGGDTYQVRRLLNLPETRFIKEAYKFQAPVSPHWAAEQENQLIKSENLLLPSIRETLIIETAGGLLVPLTRQLLQIDQLILWGLPVILVARTSLGTLNHTLLSIEALRNRNIPLLGLILNGPEHEDNPKTLRQIGEVEIIGRLPPLKELNAEMLAKEWHKQSLDITFKRLLR